MKRRRRSGPWGNPAQGASGSSNKAISTMGSAAPSWGVPSLPLPSRLADNMDNFWDSPPPLPGMDSSWAGPPIMKYPPGSTSSKDAGWGADVMLMLPEVAEIRREDGKEDRDKVDSGWGSSVAPPPIRIAPPDEGGAGACSAGKQELVLSTNLVLMSPASTLDENNQELQRIREPGSSGGDINGSWDGVAPPDAQTRNEDPDDWWGEMDQVAGSSKSDGGHLVLRSAAVEDQLGAAMNMRNKGGDEDHEKKHDGARAPTYPTEPAGNAQEDLLAHPAGAPAPAVPLSLSVEEIREKFDDVNMAVEEVLEERNCEVEAAAVDIVQQHVVASAVVVDAEEIEAMDVVDPDALDGAPRVVPVERSAPLHSLGPGALEVGRQQHVGRVEDSDLPEAALPPTRSTTMEQASRRSDGALELRDFEAGPLCDGFKIAEAAQHDLLYKNAPMSQEPVEINAAAGPAPGEGEDQAGDEQVLGEREVDGEEVVEDHGNNQQLMLEVRFGSKNLSRRGVFSASVALNELLQSPAYGLLEGKHFKITVFKSTLLLAFRSRYVRNYIQARIEDELISVMAEGKTVTLVCGNEGDEIEDDEAVEKLEKEVELLAGKENVPEWRPPGGIRK